MFYISMIILPTLISVFRRDVDDICALLGCYVASSGDCILMFLDI
jgi:hypothetical protein